MVVRAAAVGGEEMILVYFISGETITMPTVTHAQAESLAAEGAGGVAYPAIGCLDPEDGEVGCFRVTEIAGYTIDGGTRDGLAEDEFDQVDMEAEAG